MLPQAPPLFRPLKFRRCSAEDKALLERAQAVFKPLPDAAEMQKIRPFTEEQVKLGQQLWYETRLSKAIPSAVTPATTWQRPAWTTCRPARATKANSAPVNSPDCPRMPPCWAANSGTAVPPMWKNKPTAHCSTRLKWPTRPKPMPPPKSPAFPNNKRNSKPHSLKTARFPLKTSPLHWARLNVPC